MYSDDQIFIWDFETLLEAAGAPSPKNLMDACVSLRKLLIDSEPLLHKVGRNHNIKVRFTVSQEMNEHDLVHKIQGLALRWQDASADTVTRETKSLDGFLKYKIAYIDGVFVTVKEVVLYVANVGGAIHHGRPRNKDNASFIHSNANELIIEGKPYPLAALRGIVRVTVVALQPLYDVIKTRH